MFNVIVRIGDTWRLWWIVGSEGLAQSRVLLARQLGYDAECCEA